MKHDYLDKYSSLDSVLHKLDPRTKIVCFFSAVIVIVSEPRGETAAFLFYYLILAVLLLASRIPASFFLKRCLIASPFILMAALMLPVSFFLGGESASRNLNIGVVVFSLSILLKAYAAILLLVLLTSTDKFHRLLKGMRSMHLPNILTMMSALMYRYIFIINDERLKTNRARDSRSPGRFRSGRIKVYGNQTAKIFLRSWKRAQTVYQSMLSRGFKGDFPEFFRLQFKLSDGVFTVIMLVCFGVVRVFI